MGSNRTAAGQRRLVEQLVYDGYIKDPSVRTAFLRVRRDYFVLPEFAEQAFEDKPLVIFGGQTISAPSMVAIMLEAAEFKKGEKVLEIGTGSGYEAALIACLVGAKNLISVEVVPELMKFGEENLRRAGLSGVKVVLGDGWKGYIKKAPYNCVISSAAPPEIPLAWKEQVRDGGRIVAPVGKQGETQTLIVARKLANGEFVMEDHGPCSFVPLVHGE